LSPDDFIRAYSSSAQTGGVDKTLSMIADDAVYWFSDGSVHVGKPAIEIVLRRNFELIKDETYLVSDVKWVAQSDEVAVCVYRYDWAGVIHGQPASGFGRGTSVIKRNGVSWLVVHEHLSKGDHHAR
jgi:ketosteroid isomerase-like protein